MEACMAALLVGVIDSFAALSMVPGACLVCELCLLAVVCVDLGCALSFVFLGGARCLELSPCNTATVRSDAVHN